MTDKEAWVRFAAAAVMNSTVHGAPAAARVADVLLAEMKKRDLKDKSCMTLSLGEVKKPIPICLDKYAAHDEFGGAVLRVVRVEDM